MLQLKDIFKIYTSGDSKVDALRGISLTFRENEFISILGQSGCGKTTMLNIIGGLDRYTSGDLIINDKSTKLYTDRDWDTYRNHSVGFVFQSYNLIPHQTIIENVELALSIGGISKSERRERAVKALNDVGLGNQLKKKPNQLSGGQMQRVAIARALVNNPDIILADEPTGALDSETSVQVMDLLKEIAQNKLVIMVTHNPALASQYSTRIIKMLDGKIVDDSNPVSNEEEESLSQSIRSKVETLTEKQIRQKEKKAAMSQTTSFKLSFKNILTKKRRTLITSIASSIGIIGIAVILSVSNGMQKYVNTAQEQSTSTNYIIINGTSSSMMGLNVSDGNSQEVELEKYPENAAGIYPYTQESMIDVKKQNLSDEYISYVENKTQGLVIGISYARNVAINALTKTSTGTVKSVTTSDWTEILDNKDYILKQYTVLATTKPAGGEIPTAANEVVLVVDEYNRLSTETLDALGIEYNENLSTIDYNDVLGKEYRIVFNDGYYSLDTSNPDTTVYRAPVGETQLNSSYANENGTSVKIVSILREKEDASSSWISNGIGYTSALTDLVLEQNKESAIVKAQMANPKVNVLDGTEFRETTPDMSAMMEMMGMPIASYDRNMSTLGQTATPSSITIYPSDFENKDKIIDALDAWNTTYEGTDKTVDYIDISALVTSILGTLINIITYALTAFSTVSLVVSSIMIAIIIYASVIERIREIGILRAMGARKKDVSRVFRAEAMILGFVSGVIALLATLGICAIINIVLGNLTGVTTIATLSIPTAICMLALSIGLTLVASLIPASIAAKKDPVVALRSE